MLSSESITEPMTEVSLNSAKNSWEDRATPESRTVILFWQILAAWGQVDDSFVM